MIDLMSVSGLNFDVKLNRYLPKENMRITKFFLLGLLILSLSVSAQTRDPLQHFFYASFGDLSEELVNAREDGQKGVLLMFEEDDCPFCARMKKTVLNRVDVQEYFRANLRPILIDKELTDELVDFDGTKTNMKDFSEKKYRVRATPVFLVFDLDGNLMQRGRYTGAVTSVEEFMQFGRFYTEGINNEMSFTRYKKSLKN